MSKKSKHVGTLVFGDFPPEPVIATRIPTRMVKNTTVTVPALELKSACILGVENGDLHAMIESKECSQLSFGDFPPVPVVQTATIHDFTDSWAVPAETGTIHDIADSSAASAETGTIHDIADSSAAPAETGNIHDFMDSSAAPATTIALGAIEIKLEKSPDSSAVPAETGTIHDFTDSSAVPAETGTIHDIADSSAAPAPTIALGAIEIKLEKSPDSSAVPAETGTIHDFADSSAAPAETGTMHDFADSSAVPATEFYEGYPPDQRDEFGNKHTALVYVVMYLFPLFFLL